MSEPRKKQLAFERGMTTGHRIEAWYLEEPSNGDALVEISHSGGVLRRFLYPAYKVWNLAAHFEEIVDGLLHGQDYGFRIAGSDGLGGCVMPQDLPSAR